MEYEIVTAERFAAMEQLDDWSFAGSTIVAEYVAGSFPAAAALVVRIAEAAEAAEHHPDIDLRYPDRVRVTLSTHSTGAVTTLDTDLARRVSRLIRTEGADPAQP